MLGALLFGAQIIHHATKNQLAKGLAVGVRFELRKVVCIGEKSALNNHAWTGHFSAHVVVTGYCFVVVAGVTVEGLLQALGKFFPFRCATLVKHLRATARKLPCKLVHVDADNKVGVGAFHHLFARLHIAEFETLGGKAVETILVGARVHHVETRVRKHFAQRFGVGKV